MTITERKLKEKGEMRKAKRTLVILNDVDMYLSNPKEGKAKAHFDRLN